VADRLTSIQNEVQLGRWTASTRHTAHGMVISMAVVQAALFYGAESWTVTDYNGDLFGRDLCIRHAERVLPLLEVIPGRPFGGD